MVGYHHLNVLFKQRICPRLLMLLLEKYSEYNNILFLFNLLILINYCALYYYHNKHFWTQIVLLFNVICCLYAILEFLSKKPGAHSGSHRFPMFCYSFRVEWHVSWKQCATEFEKRFYTFIVSLVWWVYLKCQPNQQQRVYKPCSIKETAHTMGPSEVI